MEMTQRQSAGIGVVRTSVPPAKDAADILAMAGDQTRDLMSKFLLVTS